MLKENLGVDLDGRVTRLFEDKTRWTQGTYAKDKSGERVFRQSPDAFCYCLAGAILSLYPEGTGAIVSSILETECGETNIVYLNDVSGYDAVMDFCRRNNI